MATPIARPDDIFVDLARIPEAARFPEPAARPAVLVGGEVRAWDGPTEEVTSPVFLPDGEGRSARARLGEVAWMTGEQSLEALEAASRAWDRGAGAWPRLSVHERIEAVEAFIPRMVETRDAVVRALMWEVCKTLPDAEKEFDRTVDYLRATIEALKELDRQSSRFALEAGFLAQIRRAPLGVTLCMGPYNYPLNETFTTLFPALIMGNPVIVKPPKHGALLYHPLLDAFARSFPPGVVNTISGDGATIVGPLMESGRIDVLAFIGSAGVANILKHQHPRPNRLRSVLGLGAKNPAVILPGADLGLAATQCLTGALSFNGQRCTAIKVIFCPRADAEAFAARLADGVSSLLAGLPWEPGVKITPLPEPHKPAWLAEVCADAVAKGARVMNPAGGTVDRSLFHPAVLYPCSADMVIGRKEQFGPVVPVIPYDDVAEVVDYMTESAVGQQVALFGDDEAVIGPLVDVMANLVCRINLNGQCQRGPDRFPFTGRKDSAEGTLSVHDALRCFSIRSLVAAPRTDANEELVTRIVRGRHSAFLSTDFIF